MPAQQPSTHRIFQFADHLAGGLLESGFRLWTVFFLLIAALKWPFLGVGPVWDEAFSVFPAADFLAGSGFDYFLLLEQPGYHEGGPKAHGLSLMTFLTALVLKLTGGGRPAWMVLHILQWFMAAGLGAMLAWLHRHLFGQLPALLMAVLILVYPLVMAQLGFMYLEIPLLFFTLAALLAYLHDRPWTASALLLAASLTKGSALIGVGALTLTAMCTPGKSLVRRLLEALILAVPSLLAIKGVMMATASVVSMTTPHTLKETALVVIQNNARAYQAFIAIIPELNLILPAALAVSLVLPAISRRGQSKGQPLELRRQVICFHCLFVAMFFFFYFVLFAYAQRGDVHFLTRYCLYAIPAMFTVLYAVVDRLVAGPPAKAAVLLVLIVLCLLNRSGWLYPPLTVSNIAMAERSEEYIDGHLAQKGYISMIQEEIPPEIPVYVGLPDYFLTRYPGSGYVTEPLRNVSYVGHLVKEQGPDFTLPDHFVLVYSYPGLGGQFILNLLRASEDRDDFSVKPIGYFERGFFKAHLFEVQRNAHSHP